MKNRIYRVATFRGIVGLITREFPPPVQNIVNLGAMADGEPVRFEIEGVEYYPRNMDTKKPAGRKAKPA